MQQLYALPSSQRYAESDGLILTLLRFRERRVGGIPHGNHYHFIPYTKLSALEEKIARRFLYLATVGSQHLWKIQAKPTEHPALNQIIIMTKTVTMEVRIPTTKIMTMMERSNDHHHGEEHDHGFAADRVISEDEAGL